MFCQGINCKAADSSGNVYISLRLSSYLMLNPYPLALKQKNQEEFWSCFWITVKVWENRSLRKRGCFCVRAPCMCVSVCVCERESEKEREKHFTRVNRNAGKTRLAPVWVSCLTSPCTCTGPASCWPSWCSLTNPWRFCGWSGRSSPPVSSAFEYQMAKAGPRNCQGIWLERLPTQHAMFF